MMSKLSTTRTVALALGLSAAAVAVEPARADMPPIWTGFYVGAHGGYGEALDVPAPFDVSGGVLGLHAGYNHQAGMFVIGVEGDWSGSNIEDTQTAGGIRVKLHVDDLASIRARLGVVAWQNALLYGTVGYAWGEAGTNVNFAGLSFGRSTDSMVSSRAVGSIIGFLPIGACASKACAIGSNPTPTTPMSTISMLRSFAQA